MLKRLAFPGLRAGVHKRTQLCTLVDVDRDIVTYKLAEICVGPFHPGEVETALNAMAADGWEFVSMVKLDEPKRDLDYWGVFRR